MPGAATKRLVSGRQRRALVIHRPTIYGRTAEGEACRLQRTRVSARTRRLRIEALIGRGGMGVVYRATTRARP